MPDRARDRFGPVRQIADAVLYEGYILYPYRSTSAKNQIRWQFGVLAPASWCAAGGCENAWMQSEILVDPGEPGRVVGQLRFLQLQHRAVEDVGGTRVPRIEHGDERWTAWDEGVEQAVDFEIDLAQRGARTVGFTIAATVEIEPIVTAAGVRAGSFFRQRWPLAGELRIAIEPVDMTSLLRVAVRVENVTPCGDAVTRDEALRSSFVGAHTLFSADDAAFLSLLDPPEFARPAVAACKNVRTWPVVVGEKQELMLSSPIILYDQPQIAPESPGDLHDGTEIDEILTLRTMTLTEDEKREARATDARAAAIIDRVDHLPPEMLEKLHGALRSVRPVASPETAPAAPPERAAVPWFDPVADAEVSPDTDTVEVGGATIAKGCHVRLRPGVRRSDAQDMFLVGREATVQGVFIDVDSQRYVAVTLDDDPVADLHIEHGRFLYFYPDELESIDGARP